MVAISNVVLFAVSAAAALIPRDAATAKADLQTVNSDIQSLTTAVNNYPGGGQNLVPVVQAEQKLENDLDAAAGRAKGQPVVSATDAQSIIDYINNTLEPSTKGSITALQNKKTQFTNDGLKPTVLNNLNSIKNRTSVLGASLVKSAPSTKSSAAQAALNKVVADINAGITTYST
ncbi:hydrophobic surface binding protein [Dissoconium aciculare CBS 342.82]|uniref:Hydrophobic surface binding protein n=1 Tax=Dissoconium aciculare CBS 342.82 TaxID=1314786 RepID=A0A6J3LWR1_9PEZI|nr:hydrophobic surface binding protein [Dissoconium aciculare CBS 342.82]KAF1819077.1 hydrophobic surface binding protein [Dissoconium aciculare CBS 342.82]